jgi:hypothetical protein
MAECGLATVLLVGTGRARAIYHECATVWQYPALYLYGVILQERDDYNPVRDEH